MKFRLHWYLVLAARPWVEAFVALRTVSRQFHVTVSSTLESASATAEGEEATREKDTLSSQHQQSLTHQSISTLRFRELKRELEARGEPTDGTTSFLRTRLRAVAECVIRDDGVQECGAEVNVSYTCHGVRVEVLRDNASNNQSSTLSFVVRLGSIFKLHHLCG